MPISNIYTTLPLVDLDFEEFTSHYSEIVDGSNGEKYAVLSFFPSVQKYSLVNDVVCNKYVLFANQLVDSMEYTIDWVFDIFNSTGASVLSEFTVQSSGQNTFELGLFLHYSSARREDWDFTLIVQCHISKNGRPDKILQINQLIVPIESELLSENLEIPEGESFDSLSAVALGNEQTTHFVRGHLSEYLIDAERHLNPTGNENPDNASVLVPQAAAIVYNNILAAIDELTPLFPSVSGLTNTSEAFAKIFTNQNTELSLPESTTLEIEECSKIGICSLNLHHVIPLVSDTETSRLTSTTQLTNWFKDQLIDNEETYVLAYLRSVFPKSAIRLSIEIMALLFKAFKLDSGDSSPIYQTFVDRSEQSAKITEWKDLNFSDLKLASSRDFMKNLFAEYYFGYFESVSTFNIEFGYHVPILRIQGAQFIQLLLLPISSVFSLEDFLTSNIHLEQKVERIFRSLSSHDRVAQMIMPAAETAWKKDIDDEDGDGSVVDYVRDFTRDGPSIRKIPEWIAERKVGGVLLLSGTPEQVARWSRDFKEANQRSGALPLLFSADAEPSLINDKIPGLPAVKFANTLTSLREVEETAAQICDLIQEYGINYNFAPVVDVAKNFVKKRGFSTNHQTIIDYAKKFIEVVQSRNIIATAKHFPGHGEVIGDTHEDVSGGDDEKIVVIDGAFQELDIYPPLIANGVLSIMIAHIVVRNNDYHTDGLPASVSKRIVTDLLRDQLGFEGLIVTDGMNMGAVTYVENECIKAVEAGVDIIEIPQNPSQTHTDILTKYNADADFAEKVDTACKRIVRMKVCLGLI